MYSLAIKFKEYIWNPIIAGVEALIVKRSAAGDALLAELRSLAPDVARISALLQAAGFKWTSDPLGGYLDFHSSPRVTCNKKTGDCDDFAHLWASVLKYHGARWILHTYSTEGGGHAMCVFQKEDKFYLLSNLFVAAIANNRDVLDKHFYGDKTKKSYYTRV